MNSKIAITLKDYNLGKLKNYKLLTHGFANENYRIETGKGVFHYRIYKRHSTSTVNSEINFLHVLKKTGFPAAFPVQKSDGTYICLVKDKTVVIFDFIEGEIPQLKEKTMSETGKAVAKLNLIDSRESFQKKNIINIQNAIKLVNQFSNAKYQYPDIYHDFSVAVNYLKDKIKDDLPKGFIHGDVFPDNTIFKADKLMAIIDFEEFCVDSLLFDVAMTINGFCFIDNRLDLRLLKSF